MRVHMIRTVSSWLVRTALLVGLGYSILSFTVITTPAHASSCVCDNEQLGDAQLFCNARGWGIVYPPSYSCTNGGTQVRFQCEGLPGVWQSLACD